MSAIGQPPSELRRAVSARRHRVEKAWQDFPHSVLVPAGRPIAIPGRLGETYPFKSHSNYLYLTGLNDPGGVLVRDEQEGWLHFVDAPASEAIRSLSEYRPLAAINPWLEARRDAPFAVIGAGFPHVASDSQAAMRLNTILHHVRRAKDPVEIAHIRAAIAIVRAGFSAAAARIEAGMSERQLQAVVDAAMIESGATALAFPTLVGSGSRSADPHPIPTNRAFEPGEAVVVDAGAESSHYVCDITRTFGVGRIRGLGAELLQLVTFVQQRAVAKCRPGVEFYAIHRDALVDVASGLRDIGLVRVDPATCVEQGVLKLFAPHGLGHLVGLGLLDATGTLPDRVRELDEWTVNLMLDIPLEPGNVLTVEPGIYVRRDSLDADVRRRFRNEINWGLVETLRADVGVRIEDDILVTNRDPEILSSAV